MILSDALKELLLAMYSRISALLTLPPLPDPEIDLSSLISIPSRFEIDLTNGE